MREAIILKETKFCKLMKINSVFPDIFSLLIEHTSYKKTEEDHKHRYWILEGNVLFFHVTLAATTAIGG